MSTVNIGNQKLTFDFKQEATSEEFNTLLRNVASSGILEGGELSIVGASNQIQITPFTAIFNIQKSAPQEPYDKAVRVITDQNIILPIGPSLDNIKVPAFTNLTAYLYAWLEWENAQLNFLNFGAIPTSTPGIDPTDPKIGTTPIIIFGIVTYSNSGTFSAINKLVRTRGVTRKEYLGSNLDLYIQDGKTFGAGINEAIKGVLAGDMENWNYAYSVPHGTYPEYYTTKIYTHNQSNTKIKLIISYGTTGPAERNITQIVYQLSTTPVPSYTTIFTETFTYGADGMVLSAAWT